LPARDPVALPARPRARRRDVRAGTPCGAGDGRGAGGCVRGAGGRRRRPRSRRGRLPKPPLLPQQVAPPPRSRPPPPAPPAPPVRRAGHERATPLCAPAADRRASTPSAAGRLVVPDLDELLA